MEIASAAWAQWAGGCGTCLKEMGNPVRGEVTTTAVPLVCEPGGHGGCQCCCGSGWPLEKADQRLTRLAAWASSSFSLTPCSGSPAPVPFDSGRPAPSRRISGWPVAGSVADRVLESLRHRWSSQTQREAGPPAASDLARRWRPLVRSGRDLHQVEGCNVTAAAPSAPAGANGFRPPRNH